jgi:hypothetical protein
VQPFAQEKKLSLSRENEEFKKQTKNTFIQPVGKKAGRGRKTTENIRESKGQDQAADNRTADAKMKKADLPVSLSSVRSERVQEARKKRQNGDYDNREVYQRIAERLMDLFGI